MRCSWILVALLAVACARPLDEVCPECAVDAEPAPAKAFAAAPEVEALALRAAPVNDRPEFAAAVARLETRGADVWSPECATAPITYIILDAPEFERDWYADYITGHTFAVSSGWLLLVKASHGPKYDPRATLEHEALHALLHCAGADRDDNHDHVGPWWDGIR